MDQIKSLLDGCKNKAEMVNKMRRFEESERHWYCRKSFLLKNWDDFSDESRHILECHSICWANLHFLGCNYPFKVLAKVNEMSYGLPNMSDMLKYADQEVADMAVERRQKRRADFEANAGKQSKIAKTDRHEASRQSAVAPVDPKNLPPPLRPSAKQIGLFLTLSSGIKKKKLGLMDAVRAANTKISFLAEEVGPHNLEAMRQFHQRPEIIETDEVVEVNVMGVFVAQEVGSRSEARQKAEEAALFKLSQPTVVVVSSHRAKFNGKVVSELAVSNSRGAKKLGQVAPKLKSPEIRVEPI